MTRVQFNLDLSHSVGLDGKNAPKQERCMKAPHLPGLPSLGTRQGQNSLPLKAGKAWHWEKAVLEAAPPDATGSPHIGTPQVLTSLLFPGLPTRVIFGDLPLLFSALSCLFSPDLLREGKTEGAEQRRCFGGTTKTSQRGLNACQLEEKSCVFYPPRCCPSSFLSRQIDHLFPLRHINTLRHLTTLAPGCHPAPG